MGTGFGLPPSQIRGGQRAALCSPNTQLLTIRCQRSALRCTLSTHLAWCCRSTEFPLPTNLDALCPSISAHLPYFAIYHPAASGGEVTVKVRADIADRFHRATVSVAGVFRWSRQVGFICWSSLYASRLHGAERGS